LKSKYVKWAIGFTGFIPNPKLKLRAGSTLQALLPPHGAHFGTWSRRNRFGEPPYLATGGRSFLKKRSRRSGIPLLFWSSWPL